MAVTSILARNALTTYSAAKSRLNSIGVQIVDADSQNEIERMLNAISTACESYCGRRFGRELRTEQYSPPAGELLCLKQTPVCAYPAPVATIDGSSAECAVEDAELGFLRCEGGWLGDWYEEENVDSVAVSTVPQSAERVLRVTYSAGYVLPQSVAGITAWANGAAKALGAVVKSADAQRFAICTVAGTTGATEPTWLDRPGMEVADGTGALVWTMLEGLPADLEEVALMSIAIHWKARQGGYTKLVNETNSAIGRGVGGFIPDSLLYVLDQYRRGAEIV